MEKIKLLGDFHVFVDRYAHLAMETQTDEIL